MRPLALLAFALAAYAAARTYGHAILERARYEAQWAAKRRHDRQTARNQRGVQRELAKARGFVR